MIGKLSRRECVGGATGLPLLGWSGEIAAAAAAVTPEQFGAKGDGRTNDTLAFMALSEFVNRRGGGQIALRQVTYIVGRQASRKSANYAFGPADILAFSGCTAPLVIRGNGARLRAAPGLRFGTFDPRTGTPTRHKMPYLGSHDPSAPDLASPYFAMIDIENCSGPVEISDIELDGNSGAMVIGGQYGDSGWQIPSSGIRLRNNRGAETLSRIRCHHHLLDGLTLDGPASRSGESRSTKVVCEYNGRQGCSLVGGRRYVFVDCKFNHTGRAGIMSAPGAGFDVEAEDKTIRDVRFSGCEFVNNSGAGMIADSGDAESVSFERCRFVGTSNWSAWPRKPHMSFDTCEFVGAIVSAYGDKDPARAAHFRDCTFRDDPTLSPTGKIYAPPPLRTIAELPYSPNARFDRCRFLLTHDAVLPWSQSDVIYADCTMSQKAAKQSYPRGTFLGHSRIDGNVDLYGSKIVGTLVLNGTTLQHRTMG
jgi:hypothetical protein